MQTNSNQSRYNKKKIDRIVHTVRMAQSSVEKIVLTWMVTQRATRRGRLNITLEMKVIAEGVKQDKLRSMPKERQA